MAPVVPPDPPQVLVVEDHADTGESLATVLQFHGYQVWLTRTGADGLAAAAVCPPAVVVLDLRLPDLDGWVVASRLPDGPDGGRPTVIVVSGSDGPADRARAAAAGIAHYFVKPVDPAVLVAAVAAATGGPAHPARAG